MTLVYPKLISMHEDNQVDSLVDVNSYSISTPLHLADIRKALSKRKGL